MAGGTLDQAVYRRPGRLAPSLHSTYFHLAGGGVRPGSPPGPARRDLQARLRVAVVYSGSGAETINYAQTGKTVCTGNGQYGLSNRRGSARWHGRFATWSTSISFRRRWARDPTPPSSPRSASTAVAPI